MATEHDSNVVFVVLYSIVFSGFTSCFAHAATVCVDPCTSCCTPGDFAGDPNDCTKYLQCNSGGNWISGLNCNPGLVFDIISCACNYNNTSVCQGPCPTVDPNQTPQQPGLCDGVSTCTTIGDLEPDKSACEYYYHCDTSFTYVRKQCTTSSPINFNCSGGTACVYDIYSEKCLVPYPGFSCDYRCVTTIAPSTPSTATKSYTSPFDMTTTYPMTTQSASTLSTITTAPSIKYEPLSYRISHNGSFSSVSGDVFSQSCTLQYSDDFNQQVDQMSRDINERIGLTVCVGKTTDGIRVLSASSSMVISGNQGTTFQFWLLKFSQSQSIGDVDRCAVEMSNFLLNHQNWPDPILPGVPGCPVVQFNPIYFTVVAEEWVCDGNPTQLKVSGASKSRYSTNDLGYSITHNGLLYTSNGQALSPQCNYAYSSNLQRSTAEQIAKTNKMIGSQLCSGKSFNIVSGSASLTTYGNTTLSRQVYSLRPSVSTYFEDVYACANEISAYLRPHSNWDQPIISPEAGCPTLIYDPQYYTEDGQSWSCG